jgi:hypothetical protein
VRSYSIIAGLKVFLKNPIIGLGISKASTAMSQLFASQGLIYDQTSTTSAFLAMFGLLTAMLFTIPYFRLFKNSLGDKISYFSVILVLGGIFFSINNERFIYELTYYIFVVYGLVYVPEKLNQDEGEFI